MQRDLKALEQILAAADGSDGQSEPVSPAGKRLLSEMRTLAAGLADASDWEQHLTLEALGDEVRVRRELGQRWAMPEHLASCSLCLEAFELLLAGLPPLPAQATRRFVGLGPQPVLTTRPAVPRARRMRRWLAAATVLIAAGVWSLSAREPAHVDGGKIALSTGDTVPAGTRVPDGEALIAQDSSQATFADGSQMRVESGSRFSIATHRAGYTTVTLDSGTANFSVAKQPRYRKFCVSTSLGDVIVVGTRFRVSAGHSDVTVFRNTDAAGTPIATIEKRQLMVVTVEEGTVRVQNPYEQVILVAGQVATLREDQPKIDVGRGS